jgi:hypothetical protein
VKVGSNKSWETLRNIYLLIQEDYKKKYEHFKTSGNHESNFHDICHGRLDTYYIHVCLQLCDSNGLLDSQCLAIFLAGACIMHGIPVVLSLIHYITHYSRQ